MRKTIFPIVIQNGYDVLKYVYPTQQENVQKLIESVMTIDDISYVILFGSSVSEFCSKDSDIDILILLDADMKKLKNHNYRRTIAMIIYEDINYSFSMDILFNNVERFKIKATTINIYRKILEDGIIIYNKMWLNNRTKNVE